MQKKHERKKSLNKACYGLDEMVARLGALRIQLQYVEVAEWTNVVAPDDQRQRGLRMGHGPSCSFPGVPASVGHAGREGES